MTLTRHRIVDTAVSILRQFGLADLSMRRLARELDVQAGAIYWHIDSKQALLIEVASRLLEDVQPVPAGADDSRTSTGGDDKRALCDHLDALRRALLPVPDAADVVEVAYALDPTSLPAIRETPALVRRLGFGVPESAAVSRVLIHHVLGTVAAKQVRDRAAPAEGAINPGSSDPDNEFVVELEVVLQAITAPS